jgi:phosphomannomutase
LKQGICEAVRQEKWEDLVNAFHRHVRFGTGGIRTMMAFDRDSIVKLKNQGIQAPILKGTNTINDVVLLLTSAGAAKFGRNQSPTPFSKIVIGYDSRVRGADFAAAVAQLFLAHDYTVYLFDEACPFPELTFAIPHKRIRADLGVFISASHNDYRYNGYKLTCGNGSQFDIDSRNDMYENYIAKAEFSDIKLCPLDQAPEGKLIFLGGDKPLDNAEYYGRQDSLVNMHQLHREHMAGFLMNPDLPAEQARDENPLSIGYCAFHGAGRRAVPRLLKEVGFGDAKVITNRGLNDLNGLFPCFNSDPGREQQPDPGDPMAAEIAVEAFKEQYPGEFDNIDILIGTDPDADRCGVVVKVPENQRHIYGDKDYYLLPANDMWTLILWYRLQQDIEQHGAVQDPGSKFVALSHVTTDSITRLARKHGLGVLKTWVGFPTLAAGVGQLWRISDPDYDKREEELQEITDLKHGRSDRYTELCHPIVCACEGIDEQRSFNVAVLEQSNGFSILGGPPADPRSLGQDGHVRDKDGTFAALLVAEVAAWAKARGTSIMELLDNEIYKDPDIGLFVTGYEPDPLMGEYPGIEGDRIKMDILHRALGFAHLALAGDLEIAGHAVHDACVMRTGKYDGIYPPTCDFRLPDEGVRLFFDGDPDSHLTIRPSGTGNAMRFYLQLHSDNTDDLVAEKARLHQACQSIFDDLRNKLKAPRER